MGLEKLFHASVEKNPQRLAVGMEYVFVNGQAVLHNGVKIDARPGQVLKSN